MVDPPTLVCIEIMVNYMPNLLIANQTPIRRMCYVSILRLCYGRQDHLHLFVNNNEVEW